MDPHHDRHPDREIQNAIEGEVSGPVVQAGSITGDVHQHLHNHKAVRPLVRMPHRAGIVPPRAASFQHRAAAQLVSLAVGEVGTAVLASHVGAGTDVVLGLGGVGKTQLAVEYAEQVWATGEVDLLVWITASSRDAIVSSYARVAADVTGIDDPDSEHGARRCLEWLAGTSARWLVVLDDLQSPDDIRGLWPPHGMRGRAVVTTRRQDSALRGHHRRLIEVGVFTPAEALTYLHAAFADRPQVVADDAVELARDLGNLPLALAQASAYMRDRELSCSDYRARLADRRQGLASLMPNTEELPDEHKATIAATWSLSIEQANSLEPVGVAGVLLEIASLLDANGIPTNVFTAPAVRELLTAEAGRDINEQDGRDGLGCLRRLSLITWEPSIASRAVRVHALVQRATREGLSPARLRTVTRTAATALIQVWPQVERDTALGQVLRVNTDALNAAGSEYLWDPEGHAVLFRAGRSLGEGGLAAAATEYFQRLRDTAVRYLSADHPDILSSRGHIARWRGDAGDAAGALAAFEELLTDDLRVFGVDHPNTLITRSNVAYWRGQTGDAAGALAAYNELLTDRLRVYGADHPETLITRSNVAYWRGQTGDAAGALAAFEELLTDRLRVFGADDPYTLTTRGHIARWRGDAGDAAGALAAFEELLTDSLRVFGVDHPNTLITRSNVAYWRGQTGDAAGALAAFEELLTDDLRVFGVDHPETLITRSNVAYWRGQTGDAAGALAAFEELLTDSLRVLGADHPNTLNTRSQIARWRGDAGDAAGALAAFEELLTDDLRVFGVDHPETLITRSNVAYWRGQTGDAAGALAAFEELLTDSLRVLGADHPNTLNTRSQIARWRKQLFADTQSDD
ncbi:tetratricopeptide (TPR) repeat protein [Kibdelosporangium banguiense]|uniref:Tetratricopeptide (TPR) repeat protein n=1 Tax=Kibdelosporangium banguiense TaxID=1365924 RepID=A0ABS4U1V8_9PSEU|nr:FxSxx-COOH system tetratricopeptide repeat protein [Kibdelosporangium banguiense]MBP2330601.1 tetratricopeptide (TPR) repeat protein [Kibdelosporangium banguiense]